MADMSVVELDTTKTVDILDIAIPAPKRQYTPTYHHGKFSAGEIYAAGSEALTLYIIDDGLVYIYYDSEEGKRVVLEVIKKGPAIIGFEALGGSSVYSESAAALRNTTVSCIDHRVIDQLYVFPKIAQKIMDQLSDRIKARDRLAIDRSIRPVKARAARALLMLADKPDHKSNPFLNFPHWLIAEVANTARETITDEIGRFEGLGIVALGSGKITLLNEEVLERIANLER